ncbi:PspC domain-containing protein [Candidatus Microgenomates bacterium]|nr:MAG: PspC domain-containing protein [Candidatus Microgenomates bacterium]
MAKKKVKNPKKLFRSKKDRVIAGVMGGVGEFFGQDSTLVRIVWLLILAFTGFLPGILLYSAAAVIIPVKPKQK